MKQAIIVAVLVFLSGILWLWSSYKERQRMKRRTQQAFEVRSRARDRPIRWPLERLHPRYTRWLKQAGYKRSADKLEQQQWLIGIGAALAGHVFSKHWLVSVLLGVMGFMYPVMQVRGKARAVEKSVNSEMRLFILLLKIYVKAGVSNLQALRLSERLLKGHLRRVVHDTQALMGQMTFEEAMQVTAQESPSEDLEVLAKALRQSTKYGSGVVENLTQAVDEINHEENLRLGAKQRQAKMAIYMKFMLFFITPLILDVMLFVWGMISNAAGQL